MGALVVLGVAGFRRWATYRLATAAGAFTNSVFGVLRGSVTLAAVGAAEGTIAGYDAASAAAYVFVTQALIAPVNVFSWNELALRIRTGDIAVDLARPVDLQLQFLAGDLGRAAFVLLPRALPPLAVRALTFAMTMPTAPWPYLDGFAAVVLAVTLSFACRYVVNLAAFWLIDVRGVITAYVVVSGLLSGLLVPVAWFPPWLGAIAAATPFPSLVQAPADILTGRADGARALELLAVQLAWCAACLALGRVVQRRATRRLVVQGG